MTDEQDLRRRLPPVNAVVDDPRVVAAGGGVARRFRVRLVRRSLDAARTGELRLGEDPVADVVGAVARELDALGCPGPRPVLNGTGVALHTNLGRAPLPAAAREAVARLDGYTDLEMDMVAGRRGDRNRELGRMLSVLTGAEAGLAVNNNAAAVLLTARALAAGGEIVTSRGELVEIGGSFRIPDVIRSAGATLVEVGATNRTRLVDYRRAVGGHTRLLLKVHRSNFRLEGFTAEASREELAALAAESGLPLVEDLGSGCFVDLSRAGLEREPTPEEVLAAGVDLVTFSGDKLLGGVQAGLVVGSRELVGRLARDPLMRAVRLDKMVTAALLASLSLYLRENPEDHVPVLRMLHGGPDELRGRAEALAPRLEALGLSVEVVAVEAPVGGGSCPGGVLPGHALRLTHPGMAAERLARRLRRAPLPLVARIEEEALILDPRALPEDLTPVIGCFEAALNGED